MFAVTILGNNSALPMHDRHPTSQVVQYDEYVFLVDCGEATQIQMNRYKIKKTRIKHIFISHLHGDHFFGLPGVLTSFGLNGRTEPLYIYAPEGLADIINKILEVAAIQLPYEIHYIHLGSKELLLEEKKMTVRCFPVFHRIPCWGFCFEEKNKARKLDSEKLKAYAIPSSFYKNIAAGEDYTNKEGQLIKNDWLIKPPEPVLSYAYCADTAYNETLIEKIKDVTLLYHETTYLHDQKQKAIDRAHTTTIQAATLAKKANVGRLIIGHFSSKYDNLQPFEIEARSVFEKTDLAYEGATFLIKS